MYLSKIWSVSPNLFAENQIRPPPPKNALLTFLAQTPQIYPQAQACDLFRVSHLPMILEVELVWVSSGAGNVDF